MDEQYFNECIQAFMGTTFTILYIFAYVFMEMYEGELWREEDRAVATVLSKIFIFFCVLIICCISTPVLRCLVGKGPFKSISFLTLLATVAWSITPTVILTVVSPVQTLGAMLYVISSFVLFLTVYSGVFMGKNITEKSTCTIIHYWYMSIALSIAGFSY